MLIETKSVCRLQHPVDAYVEGDDLVFIDGNGGRVECPGAIDVLQQLDDLYD